MRDDLPEPAVRLLASLPVTTHTQPEPDQRRLGKPKNTYPGEPRKPVRIKGVEYASLKEARRVLRIGAKTLQAWVDTGMAEYV